MITALKASTGRDRAPVRRHQAPTGGSESSRAVAVAIGADPAMFVAKAVAAALTGSAALFAETPHSLAHTLPNHVPVSSGIQQAGNDARPGLRCWVDLAVSLGLQLSKTLYRIL